MSGFVHLTKDELHAVLDKYGRQYLVGNLGRPQELQHIPSTRVEVGISAYKGGEVEEPHFHPQQWEYQLVLRGHTEYYDLDADTAFAFRTGDFFAMSPRTAYAQVVCEPTDILFIKTPAINDKTAREWTPAALAWKSDALQRCSERR